MPRTRLPLASRFEFQDPAGTAWLPAQVPGCIHTDLRRHELIPDPFYGRNEHDLQWIERRDWAYRCHFDVPTGVLTEAQQRLVFDGLDTLAVITLNGTKLGETENMFVRHEFDVRGKLKPTGNLLEITFRNTIDYINSHEKWQPVKERNDPVGGRTRIRKEQCQYSWDWGPRFVTCGVWRPVAIEAWSGARLPHVHVSQIHRGSGEVVLRLTPEVEGAAPGQHIVAELTLNGQAVARAEGGAGALEVIVAQPELWWPHGQGTQPLYTLVVTIRSASGAEQDRWERRIGLRTVELVRDKDDKGETFYFRVNGRAIFAKGANWIPDHAFITECNRPRFEARLRAATDAHMNMIRVWGGGVYEADEFYDVCDELGLLVWQDFMFACALYPGAADYCAVLRPEAEQQVQRLHHRPCLALWCGNNENPFIPDVHQALTTTPEYAANYARVFHDLLPAAVAKHDGATPYWPTSPWTPPELFGGVNAEFAGDVHYWDVWHSRAPVKNYEGLKLRFCSEFGMQSYPSEATAATFCPPEERNVFSPIMESHQKNGGGNATMLHYMMQRYRYATGYARLAYLSQLSQAYCMKVGVEHFRWMTPFTMGALYWQINDCWPVASWSSIEYNGRWKALHHEARRFLAPSLLYLRALGDVIISKYNRVTEGINGYTIATVHDAPEARAAALVWSIRDFAGKKLTAETRREIALEPGTSVTHGEIHLPESLVAQRHGLYLHAELVAKDGAVLSRQYAYFSLPRFLSLSDPEIRHEFVAKDDRHGELRLTAASFAPSVALSFPGEEPWLSDNWIDLPANETRVIEVRAPSGGSLAEAVKQMQVLSLWESYQE